MEVVRTLFKVGFLYKLFSDVAKKLDLWYSRVGNTKWVFYVPRVLMPREDIRNRSDLSPEFLKVNNYITLHLIFDIMIRMAYCVRVGHTWAVRKIVSKLKNKSIINPNALMHSFKPAF